MLLRLDGFYEPDFSKLMEIYQESNTENIPYFFPNCRDEAAGRRLVEEKFREYLENDFFRHPGNCYYVLTEEKLWVSAIRLFPVPGKNNCYYAEALETRPDKRRQGAASKLFSELFSELSKEGAFEITDSVSKRNEPSIKLHLSCGFRIFQENSVCVLNGYENPNAYGLKYSSQKEQSADTEESPS